MAKGLREIKGRIKAVKGTAQITRAMQLVSSSKMKRAQDSAVAGREYRRLLADMLQSALARTECGEFCHPLVVPRPVKVRGIILVTTDKGLCGSLNANSMRLLADVDRSSAAFITVGRKGAQYVARTGGRLLADFHISDRTHFSEVRAVAGFAIEQYLAGEIDTVEVVYPQYVNTLVQAPKHVRLLPIDDLALTAAKMKTKFGDPESGSSVNAGYMKFEPSARELLDELPALFFKEELHQLILEAKASEHSARMVAMKAATDNAKKIVHALTLEYNKARQAAITQEILEITAAASA